MDKNEKWLEWAVELQSIAQAGLYYCKDEFDMIRKGMKESGPLQRK